MALINCPECGKEVSNVAESCPHCGYPIKRHIEKQNSYEDKPKQTKQGAKKILDQQAKIENDFNDSESEKEKTAEEHKKLNDVINKEKKAIRIYILLIIINIIIVLSLFCLTIWFFSLNSFFAGTISGFFTLSLALVIPVFTNAIKQSKQVIEVAKIGWDNYSALIKQKSEKINKLIAENKKEKERQNAINHPKCPHCGGNNTSRISTTGRVISTTALGLASSTIGKQYQCYDCKHKW